MDLLGMLNVLIGLTFVYFVLSLIVSAIVEGYSQLRGTRANILETAVRRIIYNAPVINHQTFPLTTSCTCPLVDDFFKHDRIQSLQRDDEKKPSEIPNDIFAKVLLETVSGMKTTEIANCPWKFREAIAKLTRAENSIGATCPRVGGSSSKASLESKSSLEDMQTTLLRIYDKSAGNYDLILQETEKWCLEVGERARGWYKSKQQRNVFIAGLLVAAVMNADTIAMFQHLSKDKQLQETIIKEASALQGKSLEEALCTKEAKAKDDCKDLAAVKSYALDVSPLLGWENAPASCLEAFQKLIGILLTACALLMGAPFWYDMLQKLLKAKNSLTGGAADAKAGTNVAGDAASADTKNPTATAGNALTPPKFNPTATQLDFGNAFWLSLFADLAYAEPDAASAKCSEWGFQSITRGLERTHNRLDTQFLIAHNEQAIILAFRGSEKILQDWAGNADFEQVAWQGNSGLNVHEGFSKAYAIVQPEIVDEVQKLMQSSRRPLWITGHSLGGALAVLAAYDFSTMPQPVRVAGLYTFGQPRVANPDLAKAIDQQLLARYWRVMNHRDAVPRVPPPQLGKFNYQHAGTVVYLDEFGRARIDPPFWFTVLDAVPTSILVDGKVDANKTKAYLSEFAGDHGMTLYSQSMLKQTQTTT